MNIAKWIRRHICRPLHASRVDAVIVESDALSRTAKDLNEHMQPYLLAPHPLSALLTDLHNRKVVDRYWGAARARQS